MRHLQAHAESAEYGPKLLYKAANSQPLMLFGYAVTGMWHQSCSIRPGITWLMADDENKNELFFFLFQREFGNESLKGGQAGDGLIN